MNSAGPFEAAPLHRWPASANYLQDGGSIAVPRAEAHFLLCAETVWAERRNTKFLLSTSRKHLSDALAASLFLGQAYITVVISEEEGGASILSHLQMVSPSNETLTVTRLVGHENF